MIFGGLTMSDLFLIAHRVRNEPAFDIAMQMECPECHGGNQLGPVPCSECDYLGFWWIIPTSGHRAYPYWSDALQWYLDELCDVPEMPDNLPDHYHHTSSPATIRTNLLDILAKLPPPPTKPFKRRF